METVSSTPNKPMQRGVYPPLFCRWRLLLAVMAVTQVSVLLLAVGTMGAFSLVWLGIASLYAQALALVTVLGVCISRAWLGRLSARGAWLGSWITAIFVALAFSYSAGIVGTVLGVGPGRQGFAVFVWQSVFAVAMVAAGPFALSVHTRAMAGAGAGPVGSAGSGIAGQDSAAFSVQ